MRTVFETRFREPEFIVLKFLQYILVCSAVLAVDAVAWAGGETAESSDLPYRCVPVPGIQNDHRLGTCNWAILADLNGDGNTDLVLRHPMGLIGISPHVGAMSVLFQYNFPVDSDCGAETPALGPVAEVTMDGVPQVPFIDRKRGTDHWSLKVYDPSTDSLVRNYDLPVGEDVRKDGTWDGSYAIEAVLPAAAPSGGPLLVVAELVRYDLYGRGLIGYDARADSVVWKFKMGPNPTLRTLQAGDLDGDGSREIVFGGNSPSNLGGKRINGTSDDESFVFALEIDGRLRWRYRLGGYYVTPYLRTADLDGDGLVEIVAASGCHAADPAEADRLCRLSVADGRELDRIDLPAPTQNFVAQSVRDGKAGSVLLCARDHRLYRIDMVGGNFAAPRLALPGNNIRLEGSGDFLPEAGEELILIRDGGTDDSTLMLLDSDLRVCSERRLKDRISGIDFIVWPWARDRRVLVYATGSWRDALEFVPNPQPAWHERDPVRWSLGVVLGGLGLLGWSVRRRRSAVAESGPARDLLLRLFRELEESSHGTLAATRGVERLVWLLEAYINSDQVEGPVLARLIQGVADFKTSVEPRLSAILEQGRQANLTGAAVRATRGSLEEFGNRLARLDLEHPDPQAFADELPALQSVSQRTVAGFRDLKETIEAVFHCDPRAMVENLLAQHDTGSMGVDVVVENAPGVQQDELNCSIDASDLRFVLENLIDNALRAMDGAERRLTIRFDVDLGRVRIDIADSGRGIAEADRLRIFDSGYSEREGGGLGLARSQQILEFWRGHLELLDSTPGRGSTFRLELAVSSRRETEGV